MSPDFIKGLDMLRKMQSLTGCCDTQPPVVVYRDRPVQSQPAAAVPDDSLQHKAGGVAAFLESTLRTNSRDIADWRDDVEMAASTLRKALAAAPQARVGDALKDMEARKDAAYLERNQVVAALAKAHPSGVARTAIEGWSEDWHGCVYIDLPTGQASWHFHDSQAYLFADLPRYTGKWDGHDTPEKYRRLAALSAAPQAPQQAEPWRPIETAPKDLARPVVVFWLNEDGDEMHDFDYTEDGCWMKWHEYAEHVHCIGGHGVNYTPPYTHWMPLPAPPATPVA